MGVVVSAANMAWDDAHPGKKLPDFFVLAVRSYYDRTIAPSGNNINAYDDAFFIVSPFGVSSWNGNVDPTRYGWNPNAGKYMARLKPGVWKFGRVIHRGKYQAFGQKRPVTVERIDKNGRIRQTETGDFGIHDHLGGEYGTSSEGCLTHPQDQWNPYRRELNGVMDKMGVDEYNLILIDGPIV